MEHKRIVSLDILRTIAILDVLLVHCTEAVYPMNPMLLSYTVFSRFLAISLFTLGRLGVPLFLFISGYLLLDKNYKNGGVFAFYRRHLFPLFITSSIWCVIYYLYGLFFYHNSFSIWRLLSELLMLSQYEGPQFWYIPVILGIYLFIPYVAAVLQNINAREIFLLGSISFFYMLLVPMANIVLQIKKPAFNIGSLVDLSFSGGVYGTYLITGYIVRKYSYVFQSIKRYIWIAIGGFSFFLLVIFQNWTYEAGAENNLQYNVWYNNALLFIVSFSIFQFFLMKRYKRNINCILWMSQASFGIFLVHNLFIHFFLSWLPITNELLKTFSIFALTLSMSIIFMLLIEMNKNIAKIITYR